MRQATGIPAGAPVTLALFTPTSAAVSFSVVVNPAKLAAVEGMMAGIKRGVPRVITRAINKVGVAARTEICRRIAAEVNLKVSALRNRNVKLTKATFNRWEATLKISGRRVPLVRWLARQTRKGVSYAIRGSQRKFVPGGFIAEMASGHRGVFRRKGTPQARRRRRKGHEAEVRPRLPIQELYGVSVPEAMIGITQLAAGVLDRRIAQDLEREIDNQAALVIRQEGGS